MYGTYGTIHKRSAKKSKTRGGKKSHRRSHSVHRVPSLVGFGGFPTLGGAKRKSKRSKRGKKGAKRR